jgi:predicted phosphohydrolase
MSIFAVGDLHLSFSTDKPMDIYGSDWIDHWIRLQSDWESKVKEDDTVIIAGDISWALRMSEAVPDLDWIHNLPGKKVLIRGNHDLWWGSISKLNKLYDDISFLQNTYYDAYGIAICGSRGWMAPEDSEFTEHDQKIYRRELIRMEMSLKAAKDAGYEDIIVAIHYPPAPRDKRDSEFTKLFKQYAVNKVVYGHLHGEDAYMKGLSGLYQGTEYSLVSLDYLNCKILKICE